MAKVPETIKKLFQHEDKWGEVVGYEHVQHDTGHIRSQLTIAKHHLSPSGVTHGGVLASLMDWSMGGAVFTKLQSGQMTSTIEFKINYLSPVKLGETIYCDAKVKHWGRSHAVIECHVFREEGKDIAVGLGTFNIYKVS